MHYLKHHLWAQLTLAAFIILAGLGGWQMITLHKAHSSFANYAAFRGCQTITSQDAASGTCTLANGQSITMVEYQNKWYLQGDLPHCMGSFCL